MADIMRQRYVDVLGCDEEQVARFDECMLNAYRDAGITSGSSLSREVCGKRKNRFMNAFTRPDEMSFRTFDTVTRALGVNVVDVERYVMQAGETMAVATAATKAASDVLRIALLFLALDAKQQEGVMRMLGALQIENADTPHRKGCMRVADHIRGKYGMQDL